MSSLWKICLNAGFKKFTSHIFFLLSPPQNDIYEWARDHRVHHKFSETDADPHNATRGFFFAHIGWLFVRKHRDVIEKGKKLDVTDLLADPVVQFQRKWVHCHISH